MSDSALVPLEQKAVIFYDDEVTAVLADEDGRQQIYVPVRPLCEYLGLLVRSTAAHQPRSGSS